jgi:hypothetical protein
MSPSVVRTDGDEKHQGHHAMRALILSLSLLGAAAASTSAFALNPQPLPPGIYAPPFFANRAPQPPDPCFRHGLVGGHHIRPMNEGWERDSAIR